MEEKKVKPLDVTEFCEKLKIKAFEQGQEDFRTKINIDTFDVRVQQVLGICDWELKKGVLYFENEIDKVDEDINRNMGGIPFKNINIKKQQLEIFERKKQQLKIYQKELKNKEGSFYQIIITNYQKGFRDSSKK